MRYLILILCNAPIIFFAVLNLVTDYKVNKYPRAKFIRQLILWLAILIVIIGAFPVYNLSANKPLLDSSELSLFDIVQTTAIVFLLYVVNGQRQQIDDDKKRLNDLHRELSIRLSRKD